MVATEPVPSVDSRFRGSDELGVEATLQPLDLPAFILDQALRMSIHGRMSILGMSESGKLKKNK